MINWFTNNKRKVHIILGWWFLFLATLMVIEAFLATSLFLVIFCVVFATGDALISYGHFSSAYEQADEA